MSPKSQSLTLPPEEERRVALLDGVAGQTLRGRFRAGRTFEKCNSTGAEYGVLEQCDRTARLHCTVWPDRVRLPVPIPEWTIVDAEFQVHASNRGRFGRLNAVTAVAQPSALDQVGTLPHRICPVAGVIERLRWVLTQVTTPALLGFVTRVFSDAALARAYFRVPASFGDHHGWPGGTAEHSTEMALNAALLVGIAPLDRELAIVEALFHDIGKTGTHDKGPISYQTHQLVAHDALTLEVLGKALDWLDREWPTGAVALRHGLTVGMHGEYSRIKPMHPAAAVVRALDNISRETALHRAYGPPPGQFAELIRNRKLWTPHAP